MSMHMIRGIQVHGKSKPKKKPGWQKAEAEHRAWLLKMGVDPDKKPSRKKEFIPYETPTTPKPFIRDTASDPSRETANIPGSCSKREPHKYTGTLIIGIGQMHKSNAVPIMRDTNQAIEIAQMRRG